MLSTLLLSGLDLTSPELPDDARLLQAPLPLPGLDAYRALAEAALEEPLEGLPLARRVNARSRVCVVVDDFVFPVPLVSRDCRREMLEAVMLQLGAAGVQPAHLRVVVGTGLSRAWRPAELAEILGPELAGFASVRCHDVDEAAELVHVGDEPEGPVELNRALIEADLVVHVNVVSQPLMAGLHGLVAGTAGYRTQRWLNAPDCFADDAPLAPGSLWHRAHLRAAAHLERRVPVLQLTSVLNNEVWSPAVAALLDSGGQLTRRMQVWNALPEAVRIRAARLLKGSYRPVVALAGPPDVVAARALELFLRQHVVKAQGETDVLVMGLPDVGPYSVGAAQNPVLAAHLALGLLSNLVTSRPLLREGGVLVVANPLTPVFDRRVHLPHEEFYEKVLRLEREGEAIHERFEPYFAARPEFAQGYQRRFAFHGTHPLYLWYQCAPLRRRAAKVLVAHGDPRACQRLGFLPCTSLDTALNRAREYVADATPTISVLAVPPPFFVEVG